MWQLADSAFPAGSFAHSGGLEAAWQQGRVEAGKSLLGFLDAALLQAAHGSVPFAIAAHRGREAFAEIDRLCHATLSGHVANRASRAQGRSMLIAAERVFGLPRLSRLRNDVRREDLPTHLAPVFGRVAAEIGIEDPARVARLFLFCALRSLVSAAVRLGIVGPMEGQAMQNGFATRLESLSRDAIKSDCDAASQTAPILELLQGAQDRLYSRLFQS